MDSARALSGAYKTTAGEIRESVADLSGFITDALELLGRPGQNSVYGPIPALYEVNRHLTSDKDDLDWRLDWIEMSDARPLGVTGQVQLVMGDTLRETLEDEGIGDKYAELVEEMFAQGKSLKQAIARAEFERDLDELAELAAEFIDDPNKNPFDYRTVDAIDERIEEIQWDLLGKGLIDQGPYGLELSILIALRDALVAKEEGSPFEIRPSDLARRHPHDLSPEAELFARIQSHEPTAELTKVLEGLLALQSSFTEQQIEDYVNAKHTLSNHEQLLVGQLGRIGRFNLTPAEVAERNAIIDELTGGDELVSQRLDELLAAELPVAVALRLATISEDAGALDKHISTLREIYGANDVGEPTHSADQLGLSDNDYFTGLNDDTIAEVFELDLAFADQGAPDPLLTDQERAALGEFHANFEALAALTAVMVFGTSSQDYGVVSSAGIHWHHLEALANGEFDATVIHDGGAFGTSYDTGLSVWELFALEYPELAATLTPAEVQRIARQLLDSPEAWNKVSGSRSGTEILNADQHDFSGSTARSGVNLEDLNGFDQQEQLRHFLFPYLESIDTANGGTADQTLSAHDFAEWLLQQPDLPHQLRDQVNSAVAAGLTDQGGWDYIFRTFEVAGYVVAGATLVFLPGGNVAILGSLTAAGVAVGVGEAVAGHQTGNDDAAAWALAGLALDLIDIAEIGTFTTAASRAARNGGSELLADAFEGLRRTNPEVVGALDDAFTDPQIARLLHEVANNHDPVALARLELELTSLLTASGVPVSEASAFTSKLVATGLETPGLSVGNYEQARDLFDANPDSIDAIGRVIETADDPIRTMSDLTLAGDNAAAVVETMERFGVASRFVNLENPGWIHYPDEFGFGAPPVRTVLEPGTRIDRYGENFGQYLSPAGTPFDHRSIPPSQEFDAVTEFEVVRPLPVADGPIAEWFDQPGNGTQYFIPTESDVQDAIAKGFELPDNIVVVPDEWASSKEMMLEWLEAEEYIVQVAVR